MQQIKYAYYLNLPDLTHQGNLDIPFDPASIAKLFYVVFVLTKLTPEELNATKLRFTVRSLHRYSTGTRVLSWRQLGQRISLQRLLQLMLQNSCNIATGMVADFCGRAAVNAFLKDELGLKHTTVRSTTTPNVTTVRELTRLLRKVARGSELPPAAREFLFQTMQQTARRAVIKEALAGDTVYSKGGTTFSGERRDCAIIKRGDKYYYAVFVQIVSSQPLFRRRDQIAAKVSLGAKSQYLRMLNEQFKKTVEEFLQK